MRIILLEEDIWVHTGCIPLTKFDRRKDMNVRKDYNIDWLADVDLEIKYNANGLFCKSIDTSSIVPSKSSVQRKRSTVPIWKKQCLTLVEGAEYFGIGIHKITKLTEKKNCGFVLWNGNKRLIKREKFEKFLQEQDTI